MNRFNSRGNSSFKGSKKPREYFVPEKLNKSKSREFIDKLQINYGCDLSCLNDQFFYLNANTGKVYLSSINLNEVEVTRFSGVGIYFGTIHDGNRFRLSLEGSKFVSPSKNFIEIDEAQLNQYISAKPLNKKDIFKINSDDTFPFLIVKFKDENLGCISIKDDVVLNYMPKSRKLEMDKLF